MRPPRHLKEELYSKIPVFHSRLRVGQTRILKRYGKNRLTKPMITEKRRIIKEKAGELAHIDCHHLSRDTMTNDSKRYDLLCVLDSSCVGRGYV